MKADRAYERLGYSQLLNMKDVRDLLGVSYDFIYKLIRQRKLKAGGLKVHPHEVYRYLKETEGK